MTHRLTVPFDIVGWEEATYDELADAPRLARATVRKTFRGDLDGESTAEVLMCQSDPADLGAGAGYVASERITGRIGDRTGSFVVQHGALAGAGTAPHTFGHIVPGSGTGDFAGIHGTAEVTREAEGGHTLTLAYDLEPPGGLMV